MSELYSLLEDFREDYRHNPSFGSIILEDLYTSSGRIIILPIGRYLHVLTFLSEVEEVCGASGCWRWNSSTTAGAWTSVLGSHMLSKFDQPINLTRYHNLPHLNLESKISSTSYSSWLLMATGLGSRGCVCSAICFGMLGQRLE